MADEKKPKTLSTPPGARAVAVKKVSSKPPTYEIYMGKGTDWTRVYGPTNKLDERFRRNLGIAMVRCLIPPEMDE